MVFKKIAIETKQFGEENFNELKDLLKDECQVDNALLLDIINMPQIQSEESSLYDDSSSDNQLNDSFSSFHSKRSKRIRRHRNKIIRDTITVMALCNNVIPILNENDSNNVTYKASSPDEEALVKFADSLNMKLTNKTDKK